MALNFQNSDGAYTTDPGAVSVTTPTGIEEGDLLIYVNMAAALSATPPSLVTPTGYTNAVNTSSTAFPATRMAMFYRVADGTEDSDVLTGMVSTNFGDTAAIIAHYRDDAGIISNVVVNDVDGVLANANPAAQVKNMSGEAPPVAAFATLYGNASGVNSLSMSPAADNTITESSRYQLAHKGFASSPSNVTVDGDQHGDPTGLQSFYITYDVPSAGGATGLLIGL